MPGGVRPDALRSHSYLLEDGSVHAPCLPRGLGPGLHGAGRNPDPGPDERRARGREAGALGSTLNQLFQRSFAVAKEVRSSTEIGEHSISMAAAAVRLAGQLFEDLSQIRILFRGRWRDD